MVKPNNSDAFSIPRKAMTVMGVWPKRNPKLLYRLRGLFIWCITLTFYTTMWMELVNDITDFTKLSEILYIMVSETSLILKLFGFITQKETFINMIESLQKPIFYSYSDDLDIYMTETINTSTFIAKLYQFSCVVCLGLFALFPILDNAPLPVPFPYELGSYRTFMYVFQLMGLYCTAWQNSCLDILTTSLLGVAAAQFDVLSQKIMRIKVQAQGNLQNEMKDREVLKQLKECSEHHLAIICYIQSIEKVFTFGLFAQFLGSILVICNTLFHIVLISLSSLQFFMLANYFLIMITQLYMYCWYGHQIMYKSISIGEASYLMDWYKCGNEVRKYLFIIMERSRRPISVTALKFSKLSLDAFATIIQWSYSYLALLLKLYYKRQIR